MYFFTSKILLFFRATVNWFTRHKPGTRKITIFRFHVLDFCDNCWSSQNCQAVPAQAKRGLKTKENFAAAPQQDWLEAKSGSFQRPENVVSHRSWHRLIDPWSNWSTKSATRKEIPETPKILNQAQEERLMVPTSPPEISIHCKHKMDSSRKLRSHQRGLCWGASTANFTCTLKSKRFRCHSKFTQENANVHQEPNIAENLGVT